MRTTRNETNEKSNYESQKWSEKSTNFTIGESKFYQEYFAIKSDIICHRCNGTGTDPEYKDVNVILAAIDDIGLECIKDSDEGGFSFKFIFDAYYKRANRNAPYCRNCYGMKKIDCWDHRDLNYKQELMDRKNAMRKWFLSDVDPFLLYIQNGEVWCKSGEKVHLDLERKRWIEVNDFSKNIDSLRAVFKWLHRFKADGYWDFEHFGDHPFDPHELSWTGPVGHLKDLTTELITSHSVTIKRLIEIKNDLDFFFCHIQDLDNIYIPDTVSNALPKGFKFTWENILRKFGLPQTHLHLFESDEIKSEKYARFDDFGPVAWLDDTFLL